MNWKSARMGSSILLEARLERVFVSDEMILGKVVGTVVTTVSHRDYKNRRLLVVQPLGVEGEKPDEDFIALDNTQAGIGDTVLVNREGSGAARC